MAKIPLRAYNREIERMIDQGQSTEAIIHCRHILKFYPKHIDTYRLLGKAYLEIQRYAEAADVLQRVLSTVPDDFISHIGLSIIREDESNLDAAIWHMERAFEAQPSNNAVQDELRRLYGRRDGVEPPKIRLTRGALVRMYARGELFQQAIAEIRVALSEDPQRVDLEVVLARMYYLSGQPVPATEVCSRLIGKLPYCFEANRILAEILPSTSRAEDAKIYQQRIFAMDPYLAHMSPTAISVAEVPDNAVTLEQLEYEPGEEEALLPDWTKTVGVDMADEQEVLPDWFTTIKPDGDVEQSISEEDELFIDTEKTAGFDEQSQEDEPLSITEPEDEPIPDWMSQAGWTVADEQSEDQTSALPEEFETEELSTEGEGIAPAEIPEWLKSIAPEDITSGETLQEDEDLGILEDILPVSTDVDTGQEGFEEREPEISEESEDLLTGEDVSSDEHHEPEVEPSFDEETPEWLKESPTEATVTEELELEQEKTEHIEELQIEGVSEDTLESTEEESTSSDIDQAMTWLETLAERQGADAETLLSPPEERSDVVPDWVQQMAAEESETFPEDISTEEKHQVEPEEFIAEDSNEVEGSFRSH
jgi:tetratricopeptide (TPR) repeat protein